VTASEASPTLGQEGTRRELLSALGWRAITRMRAEIDTVREYGAAIGNLSSLIALGGLTYWCQRCGMWMGDNPPPTGPSPEALPIPQRLIKAISGELRDEPGPRHALPPEQHSLEPRKGGKHHALVDTTSNVKTVYGPPSTVDHGRHRRIDTYHDGQAVPDGEDHGHQVNFIESDGDTTTDTLIYARPPGPEGTTLPDYESGIKVFYREQTGEYEIK
jgi:hypothetical protein